MNGWEELRRLPGQWEEAAETIAGRAGMGDPSAALATADTLRKCAVSVRAAVSGSTAPLDVERLATAIMRIDTGDAATGLNTSAAGQYMDGWRVYASRVIAEYARLAATDADR